MVKQLTVFWAMLVICIVAVTTSAQVSGVVHLGGIGDRPFSGSDWAGTKGQNRRLEGFSMTIDPPIKNLSLSYMCHIEGQGDTPWMAQGAFCGTRGQSKRMEGFALKLEGSEAKNYDVIYQVHVQLNGDSGECKNGDYCGTRGRGWRAEALRVSIAPRPSVVAKQVKVELNARQLCCDKTTEAGADEVYILVFGRRTDGATFAARIPGDNKHWDMNDSGQRIDNPNGDSRCITNKNLFTGDLEPGQSWNLAIVVMEEDGGTTKTAQEIAGALLREIGDPYTVAAGTLITALTKFGFFFKDTDDWPGSVGAQISNNNGNIEVSWNPKERIVHSIPDPDAPGNPNRREFRMNGDGSNYVIWLGVR